jgi:hypothetical protein
MKNIINRQHILIILLLALPVLAIPGDRPPAPSGFTWHVADNGVGTFLQPDGWHVLEETKGITNAIFISRENIEQRGKFITGFTVNQITSFSSSSSIKASEYAKLYIQKIIDKYEVVSSGVVKKGPNDMNVARVKGDNAGVTTIAHHIAVGMDERDELYMISFQAPESEWDTYNHIAGQMFSYFLLGS